MLDEFYERKPKGEYKILSAAKVTESWPDAQCHTDDLPGLMQEIYSNGGLIVKVLNRMEGFAMYFTSGVGDSNIAYRPVSSAFCEGTRNYLPYIIVPNVKHKQFSHTLSLYANWSMRDQKEKASQVIAENQQKLHKINVKDFPTIG